MSLEQLSKTVDFVQDATPSASDANDGETYLDTSQSPPQLKVFDAGAGAFVRPRSVQNLDAPVSGAGATQSDIETAVDNSTTASTVSNNLDIPVSNAGETATDKNSTSEIATGVDNSTTASTVSNNLDAKVSSVGGVDWTTKTPKLIEITSNTSTPTISGSGYLISAVPFSIGSGGAALDVTIDGTSLTGATGIDTEDFSNNAVAISLFARFDSSVSLQETTGSASVRVHYVLD